MVRPLILCLLVAVLESGCASQTPEVPDYYPVISRTFEGDQATHTIAEDEVRNCNPIKQAIQTLRDSPDAVSTAIDDWQATANCVRLWGWPAAPTTVNFRFESDLYRLRYRTT